MINWFLSLSVFDAVSYAIMVSPFIIIPVAEILFALHDKATRYNIEIIEYDGEIEGFEFKTFADGSKMSVKFHIPRANCLGKIVVDPHNLDQIDKAKTILGHWSEKILESTIRDEFRMKQIKGEKI